MLDHLWLLVANDYGIVAWPPEATIAWPPEGTSSSIQELSMAEQIEAMQHLLAQIEVNKLIAARNERLAQRATDCDSDEDVEVEDV